MAFAKVYIILLAGNCGVIDCGKKLLCCKKDTTSIFCFLKMIIKYSVAYTRAVSIFLL